MYYHLVATETAKRFGFRYSDLAIEPGDELTFKYRSDHPVTHLYLRDAAGETGVSKKVIDEYIEELEEFLDEAVGLVSLLADNEVAHLDIRV